MRSPSTFGSVLSQSVICWCCGTMTENSVFLSGLALRWSVRKRSLKMYRFCGAKVMKPRSASWVANAL